MELHRPFAFCLLFLGIAVYCQGEGQLPTGTPVEIDEWITKGTNDDQLTDNNARSSARSEARSVARSRSISRSKGDQQTLNDDDSLNNEVVPADIVQIRSKRTPKGGGGKGGGGKGGGGKGGGGKGGGGKGGGGKGKGGLSKDELEAIKKTAEAAKAAAEAKKQQEQNKGQ